MLVLAWHSLSAPASDPLSARYSWNLPTWHALILGLICIHQ